MRALGIALLALASPLPFLACKSDAAHCLPPGQVCCQGDVGVDEICDGDEPHCPSGYTITDSAKCTAPGADAGKKD